MPTRRHNASVRSPLLHVVLAASLLLASAAIAVAQSDTESAPPTDQATDQPVDQPSDALPAAPSLQPSDYAPAICDSASHGFRFVEVRGSGFDDWATQRLVGNLLDGNGVAQAQWGSVWVSPQGRLTLEVNLCADPFRGRPALTAGTYTLSVGQGGGGAIAATSIDVSSPPEPPAEGDLPAPDATAPAPSTLSPASTPAAFVLPNVASVPAPTPFPVSASATRPAPGPRTGPGSRQQPFPPGAPGVLADGWQLLVVGVTPDAWSGIHSAVPSSVAPAADQRDYMVRVQATYQGQGTGVFSAMRLALVSGIQTTYDQLHNGCGVVPDMVPPNLVTPGGDVRGNVCFTVRVSDLDSVVLFDNQSSDSDRLYFALR
jgi:hypothetical protein